ncbi:conserved membrane hypothetical protein [uncultured Desulfobacterium sp.]|uniref:Uncharacterized protein n=1 Tax=uncultured Desulfobacterium sp. TaxID=201089 RepID=A0A445N2D9_9BACT|nr:conserved membrane hypothetical protein [uncultured Desulfobacterium sp.]
MENDKQKNPLLNISGLIAILAILGVTIFTQSPFRSSRPTVPDLRESVNVNARLWQDPFLAVMDHLKDFDKSPSELSSHSFLLSYPTEGNDPFNINERLEKGRVTVLGVMVSGKRFAEDNEQRIRYRYALLSGLGSLGFIPEDSEHIKYVCVSTADNSDEKAASLSNIMPYEWLKYSPNEDSVLILWINDDVFRQHYPLKGLNFLAAWIGCKGMDKEKFALKIIGPAESGTLKCMLREAYQSNKGYFDALKGVFIYSALATADDSQLIEGVGQDKVRDDEARKNIIAAFRKHDITFNRTIRTDRKLAEMLIEELKLRGLKAGDKEKDILLVSEWDTFYGRSMPGIFRRALSERACTLEEDSQVLNISYLRGIDGILPNEKEVSRAEELNKLEDAAGKSQYDYLRRLTGEAYRFSKNRERSIKAIGVLGTDFYDKLLVLQAFHERFPQAVFFTTDLDARFLHPEVLKWTRNLIVASNFDLTLRKNMTKGWFGDIPPFRDNYQTSLFFTTTHALGDYAKPQNGSQNQKSIEERVVPQVFEIGRFSAVKISPEENNINPKHNYNDKVKTKFLNIAVIAIITLALLFFFISSTVYVFICETFLAHWIKAAGLMVLVAAGCYYFNKFVILNSWEEPVFLFEGVSIWPTEALRLIAIIFAVGFIIMAQKKLKNNMESIEDNFDLSFTEKKNEKSAVSENLRQKSKVLLMLFKIRDKFTYHWKVDVDLLDGLWREYRARSTWKYRILRLLPVLLTYGLLVIAIINFSEKPVAPVRGNISRIIDVIVLSITLLSFASLVFYVFDVTRCCRKFINDVLEKMINTGRAINIDAKSGNEKAGKVDAKKEYLLIHLIASHTDTVGKLIFYPFIVWFLMFVSRLRLFDNWQTPIGLAIVITMAALIVWSCAFILRRSAEDARARTVHRLKRELAAGILNDNPDEGDNKKLEFAIKEISELQEGAFVPFMKHPLVQSFFLPFGGVGGVYLFDFLTKMNI